MFEPKVIIPNDFFWSDEEIENYEELFKLVFQTFHEQKYLEKVFPDNNETITLKKFYSKKLMVIIYVQDQFTLNKMKNLISISFNKKLKMLMLKTFLV